MAGHISYVVGADTLMQQNVLQDWRKQHYLSAAVIYELNNKLDPWKWKFLVFYFMLADI